MSNFWNKIFLGFIFFLASASFAYAQPKDNFPYTRLGLGDLSDQFFFAQASMGGLSAAFHDPFHMNIANPASYSRLREAAFEIGLFAENGRLNDATGQNSTLSTWNGNLSYLSLGFPLRNRLNEVLDQKKNKVRWGMNLSLLPFSNVDYNIETQTDQVFADTLTSVDFNFEGKGGTYKVMWGNSLSYKDFSVGLNLGYFFGKIENDKFVTFPDLRSAFNNAFTDDFTVGGVTWNLGAQYDFVQERNETTNDPVKYITVGAVGNFRNRFKITRERLWRTQNLAYPISNQDTILSVSGSETIESNSSLPSELTVGVMYTHLPHKGRKSGLRLGADFKYQKWSEYVNDLVAANDADKPDVTSWRVAFGGEYMPDERSYNKYLKKVRYRFGGFYSKDPRSVQGDHLSKYGLTVGVGMPVILARGEHAFMNFGLEVGKIGLADALERTYFKLNIGFTLNDKYWFFKRKFN